VKLRLSLALAVAVLALAGPGSAQNAQRPAPAQQDWSRTVVATPEGGFRIGNPDAPVKLVEYASLTCPHCAEFAVESKASLIGNHVRSGRVSFEFRNFVLNGIDAAASLLVRCAAPEQFFGLTDRVFETQEAWADRIRGLSEADKQRIMGLPAAEAYAQVAEAGGLMELAAQHGVTAERGRQCLGDQAGLQQLERLAQAAEALGVQGTPTFFLNGRKLDVNSWAEIEPLLAG
jgi:protein-disulfide isomerase